MTQKKQNKKEYAVTVVTPFHNVDPDAFRLCCESMFAQAIGFENVNWIVVVHNCEPQYRDNVFRLLGGYDNVTIQILDNDKRTPSSPRNCGIELAKTRYIAFLDADDRYTPECLQKVLFHIKKNETQIAWFRREYELESEDSIPITEIVLWDQTREEIIIDKTNWDDEKMFSGIWAMVTSRMYDKQFLDRYHIRFDETVPFAEDYLFNLECYGHAEKICYLPQLIGYHYYINHASLVQSSIKDAATLISYAKGYKKVFDAGIRYGFYMNSIISGLCGVMARFIIASDLLTLEDKLEIKEILQPYLEMTTPLKVSKLYSEKAVRERYVFPRAVILDPENYDGSANRDTLIAVDIRTERSLSAYQRILRDILYLNQQTDVGKRYCFNDILKLSDYRAKVPESDYDVYEPLFRLQTNIGESGIITADPIRSYMFTLGSMENPQLIPCSDRQLAPLKAMLKHMVAGKRTFLMWESLPQKNRFNDNTTVNTVYGAVLSDLFTSEDFSVHTKRKLFTAPHELLFPGEVANLTYVRLLFALSDPDVDQIIAPNTWEIWETFRFLEKNWRNLCADIRSGKPEHFNRIISDEFRANIESRLKANPERADELTTIFERGFDTPVVPQIWQKMTDIYAFGEGVFAVYTAGIRNYSGDINHKTGFYMASTAVLGIETKTPGCYRMSSSNAFIEFVPAEGGSAVFAPDVEVGKDYTMLMSTYSGLYRYRLKDVVRIERVINDVPEFSYRYNDTLTVKAAGICLNDRSIGEAVLALRQKTGAQITDYAYMKNKMNNGFVLLVEINNDDPGELTAGQLSAAFEDILEEDAAYREAVAAGTLAPAQVLFMEQETQLFYRDILMNRINRPADLIQPVRYINTPVKERFFLSGLIK